MNLDIDRLYTESDRVIGGHLSSFGFSTAGAGEYGRREGEGVDRVLIDPNERKIGFSVLVSYYPDYMQTIETLSDSSEARGFPCGPYLSPAGVGRREHTWSARSEEALRVSIDGVNAALDRHGLPWLRQLRDPRQFAAAVDPVAALYAAYAHETAGDLDRARLLYEEMHRRLAGGLTVGVSESEFLKAAGKRYVFVARKLGMEDDRVRRFQELLGYVPDVKALGSM